MTAPPRRLAVRLGADALRQVRGGHPWVFDASVRSVKVAGGDGGAPAGDRPAAGDLAVIFDDRRRFAAVGLWDPDSPIRIRVLHAGAPRAVDRELVVQRLRDALQLRAGLLAEPDTTGLRLVHGENDALPGLVLDRYGQVVVLKLYTPAWFPHLDAVLEAVHEVHRPSGIVLRLARVVQRAPSATLHGVALRDGVVLAGEVPDGPVVFSERGLRYEADVRSGQKTGFFLDQRDHRSRVRSLAGGADVLDVFSCTGGFGVSAAAGGARSVHSIDISPAAIATARRNMALNSQLRQVADCAHRTTTADAFEAMQQLSRSGERFDVVVVDPPSFASRQHQVPGALRAYARLTRAALALVRPGGTLVQASCSARVGAEEFRAAVLGAASHEGVALHDVDLSGHPADHPVGFAQGAYLKALFATVERPPGRRR